MKSLLFSISLIVTLIVFSLYTFFGFRFWPAIERSLITFVATYTSGLILALVIFVPYLESKKGQADQDLKDSQAQNENEVSKKATPS